MKDPNGCFFIFASPRFRVGIEKFNFIRTTVIRVGWLRIKIFHKVKP